MVSEVITSQESSKIYNIIFSLFYADYVSYGSLSA
jgi:hypothetical protein